MVGGQTTYLPIRIALVRRDPDHLRDLGDAAPDDDRPVLARPAGTGRSGPIQPEQDPGAILYFVLIIAFTYFYTAVSFDPEDVSDNIKKYGGFIPGIRPGSRRPTTSPASWSA